MLITRRHQQWSWQVIQPVKIVTSDGNRNGTMQTYWVIFGHKIWPFRKVNSQFSSSVAIRWINFHKCIYIHKGNVSEPRSVWWVWHIWLHLDVTSHSQVTRRKMKANTMTAVAKQKVSTVHLCKWIDRTFLASLLYFFLWSWNSSETTIVQLESIWLDAHTKIQAEYFFPSRMTQWSVRELERVFKHWTTTTLAAAPPPTKMWTKK